MQYPWVLTIEVGGRHTDDDGLQRHDQMAVGQVKHVTVGLSWDKPGWCG